MTKKISKSVSYIIFTLFLFRTASVSGQQTILLHNHIAKKNLSAAEVFGYVDSLGHPPESIFSYYSKGLFAPVFRNPEFDNSRNTCSVYWMAMTIRNESRVSDWYLELHDPHVGNATVFEADNGSLKEIGKSGYYRPFTDRMIQHKNHFFFISLPPGKDKVLFVRLHSSTFAKFYVSLVKSSRIIEYSLKEYWLLGIYYGCLFILLVYNFILFLLTRQKSFLWYSLFVLSCILSGFREDGLGFQFIWSGFHVLNYFLFDFCTIFTLCTFTAFSTSFLDIRQKSPQRLKLIAGLVAFYSVVQLAESVISHVWHFSSYLYPVPYMVIYLTAIAFALKKDKSALHFVIGFTTFVLGVLCFFLRNMGLLPHNVYTIYALNFSVLFEVVIMAYALTGKYRQQHELLLKAQYQELQLLKEKAALDQRLIDELAAQDKLKAGINLELEKKVQERTTELHARNEELTEAYKQLSFYKERLETDWSKLDKEKWELSRQVSEHLMDKIKGKEVSFEAFSRIFPTNEACMNYLSDLKWAKGFVCKQCGNTKYAKGDLPYSRKCTRCTHRETVTANTLFHGVKIELTKAFYITHFTLFGNSQTTLKELAEKLEMRPATCWNFRKKVESAAADSEMKGSWEEIILQASIGQQNK